MINRTGYWWLCSTCYLEFPSNWAARRHERTEPGHVCVFSQEENHERTTAETTTRIAATKQPAPGGIGAA